MNFFQSAYNLLFDQKKFFEERPNGLRIPLILTIVYAIVASLAAIPALIEASALIPEGMGALVLGIGIISSLISLIISWIVVAAIFFACLKFIGYAECTFLQVLCVCGYVSGILLISAVLTGLISLIGVANIAALLILSGVFLLWSVPVWYFGFASICDIPEKKLWTAVLVPVILMVLVSVVSNAGVILAL